MNSTTPLQRWLIVRQGAIGDTILLSSLIQAIRRQIPQAWIEIMGNRERVELLVGRGLADAAVSSERSGMEKLFSDEQPLPPDLTRYFQSFDVILYFAGSHHQRLQHRLQVRPDMQVRVYPALPSPSERHHCVEHYLGILKGLLGVTSVPIPRISLRADEIEWANEYLSSAGIDRSTVFLLALQVGAGSKAKQAPIDLYVKAAVALHNRIPTACLITQGPADEEAVTQFRSKVARDLPVYVLENLSLRSLAAILRQCHTFWGNDSGITHMAAAVGCPTLAVFVHSDPGIWRPLGNPVRTVVVE